MIDGISPALKMKKINRSVTLQDPYYSRHDKDLKIMYGGLGLCIGAIVGMAFITAVKSCDKEPLPTAFKNSCTIKCHKDSRKKSMTDYFRKAGNKHPEQMAVAVLATSKPKLLAAMATKGEKNTPYTVRKGGYKRRHAGAWQVNPKDWGKVPMTPLGQALQAERILEDLTDKKPIKQALSHYGGDSTDKYANRVLAELVNVP
jgi:hypothetical protein